jgi:hypothetical protein
MNDLLTFVPIEKRDAVERALHATFPGSRVASLERVGGGGSPTLTYLLSVDGTRYVLQVAL